MSAIRTALSAATLLLMATGSGGPAFAACGFNLDNDADVALTELRWLRKGDINGNDFPDPGEVDLATQIVAHQNEAETARTMFCSQPANRLRDRRDPSGLDALGRPAESGQSCDAFRRECGSPFGGGLGSPGLRVLGLERAARSYVSANPGAFGATGGETGGSLVSRLRKPCDVDAVHTPLATAAVKTVALDLLRDLEDRIRTAKTGRECTIDFEERYLDAGASWRTVVFDARDDFSDARDVIRARISNPVGVEGCVRSVLPVLAGILAAAKDAQAAGWRIVLQYNVLFGAGALRDNRGGRTVVTAALNAGGVLGQLANDLSAEMTQIDQYVDAMETSVELVASFPAACPLSDAQEQALAVRVQTFMAALSNAAFHVDQIAATSVSMTGSSASRIPGAFISTQSAFRRDLNARKTALRDESDTAIRDELPVVKNLLRF